MSPSTFWICVGTVAVPVCWAIFRIARGPSAKDVQANARQGLDLRLNDVFTGEIDRVLRLLWTHRPARDNIVSHHSYTAQTQLICLMLEDESSFNAVIADDWTRAQMSFTHFGSMTSGPPDYWTTDPVTLRCLQCLLSFLDELPKHQAQSWRRRA
jgi:hypothetical protein